MSNLSDEDLPLDAKEKARLFLTAHWRGVVSVVIPIMFIPLLLPLPGENYQWCSYTLLVMAGYWVSECIPLAVTAFLPVLIFPLAGVASTSATCKAYVNDSVMLFVGSIMLAYSVEQSGLHKRLAYCAIRAIGYSHYRLLFAMCSVTTFTSLWITNTAATTMMVPINFALLKVFEEQKILNMYETDADGEDIASDITTCYFCTASYSATIGGIGTLTATATNLVFKGLFMNAYPDAPEYLSYINFSAFSIPLMVLLEMFNYLNMIIIYFGFLRPGSAAAKSATITDSAKAAAKKAISDEWKKLGKITYWEIMVILLFGCAIMSFFFRSPQLFTGWGDKVENHFGKKHRFIQDSASAMFVLFLMFLLPSTPVIFKNCSAKFCQDMPSSSVLSILDWRKVNAIMPFNFMFLLGGGFALSTVAKSTGLNERIGQHLLILAELPNILILFIIVFFIGFVTNFASNVAICNVFTPIVMQVAVEMEQNPLWYTIAAGFTSSFCFMVPVGTPGNLIVQNAANIPTGKMIKAGFSTTLTTIVITWFCVYFWAPVIWPDLHTFPDWAKSKP